ncbi:Uncharacterised protein [Actinobacillus pleuropneumoniae]|nr:Uncharacterised protein [Actinobacillus pleuropneumoniae]
MQQLHGIFNRINDRYLYALDQLRCFKLYDEGADIAAAKVAVRRCHFDRFAGSIIPYGEQAHIVTDRRVLHDARNVDHAIARIVSGCKQPCLITGRSCREHFHPLDAAAAVKVHFICTDFVAHHIFGITDCLERLAVCIVTDNIESRFRSGSSVANVRRHAHLAVHELMR